MKFLVIAAVLAYASAAPSGALYGHGLIGHATPLALAHGGAFGVAHAAPLAAHTLHGAAPTISSGDVQAAAIDAHVEASDHARAALDASRDHHDQAADIHGRAINAAEDHAWQSLNAAQTAQAAAQTAHAAADGAAAGAAPHVARQLAGHSLAYSSHAIAPAAYSAHAIAPAAYSAHAIAPAAYSAHAIAPAAYSAHAIAPAAYAAPLYAGHAGYAAPAISHATINHGAAYAGHAAHLGLAHAW